MSDDDPPSFDDPAAEARYYRLQAKDLQDELEDLKLALSDFQTSSKELEDEMERELASTEKRETELRTEVERLRSEVDTLKTRHQTSLKEHSATMTHMQKELEGLRSTEKSLRSQLRDMELDNDDLEKNERAISSTLEDMEARYNKAVERTALLESELVDKARLEEELQRVKDELRDGAEENGVLRSQRDDALAQASRSQVVNQAEGPLTPRRQGRSESSTNGEVAPSPDIDSADEGRVVIHESGLSVGNKASTQVGLIQPTPSKLPLTSESPLSPAKNGERSASPTPNPLARSERAGSQVRNLARLASRTSITPKSKRSETIISDMKDMTSRMEGLTQRLNKRRESMMTGSAIPRATPRARVSSVMHRPPTTPVPPLPGLPRSHSSSNSISRAASVRRGMVVSPSSTTFSALGKPSVNGEFKQPSSAAARPSSRLGQRMSTVADAEPMRSSRPASRLSSRPVTPSGIRRSPTPTSQHASLSASTRVPRRVSMGPAQIKAIAAANGSAAPVTPKLNRQSVDASKTAHKPTWR